MGTFNQILAKIMNQAIDPALKVLFGLAIVMFLWGLAEFIIYADNEQKRTDGKKHLVWGLIGLFIMFGVWGIIEVIRNFIYSLG